MSRITQESTKLPPKEDNWPQSQNHINQENYGWRWTFARVLPWSMHHDRCTTSIRTAYFEIHLPVQCPIYLLILGCREFSGWFVYSMTQSLNLLHGPSWVMLPWCIQAWDACQRVLLCMQSATKRRHPSSIVCFPCLQEEPTSTARSTSSCHCH
jgi:hypothetical protein